MKFWLQKENDKTKTDIDILILQEELDKQKWTHSYELLSMEQAGTLLEKDKDKYKDIVPVGTLEFVQQFLRLVYGINTMNPIEVPEVLREYKFLKRAYSIGPLKNLLKNLPEKGYYFVKYVSKLKEFTYIGMINRLIEDPEIELKEGLYQVSEAVNILSEYRCFIHNDELVAINYYDGDCTYLPDMQTVREMINIYMKDNNRPKAYTMDIAVIKNRGTAILEVHPWVSVGLYGYMFGSSLPYCYRDGLDYYIHSNKEIK